MSKVIVYTRPDGGLSVCVPVVDRFDPPGFSTDDAIARAIAKDIPQDAISVQVIERSDVPNDRTFRNAWKQEGRSVGHDMDKCREIWKDKMREARAPILAALDADYSKADESGDQIKKRDVAAKKQALRDVTKHADIDTAATPDDLKKVWPTVLGERK